MDSRVNKFMEVALPSLLVRMWQQILRHMASLECFIPHNWLRMCPLPMVTQETGLVQQMNTMWLTSSCRSTITKFTGGWTATMWELGPSCLPLYQVFSSHMHHKLACGGGYRSLTAMGKWSKEEMDLHDILEMTAILLAMSGFQHQLVRTSFMMMSNQATVVVCRNK